MKNPQNSNSLSHDTIITIYEDSQSGGNTLWIGTEDGLNKLVLSTSEGLVLSSSSRQALNPLLSDVEEEVE